MLVKGGGSATLGEIPAHTGDNAIGAAVTDGIKEIFVTVMQGVKLTDNRSYVHKQKTGLSYKKWLNYFGVCIIIIYTENYFCNQKTGG